MSNELILGVFTTTKPGCRDAYMKAIREAGIPEKVRAEDGCLCYEYYFSTERPDEVFLSEKWTDSEKQVVHMTQPHMAKLKDIKAQYVLSTQFVRYSER